jgi:hypothetical protein
MLIRLTRCGASWPRRYSTYHQELKSPYRRAEPVTVLRLGRWGLVLGRWTSRAHSYEQAAAQAFGVREVTRDELPFGQMPSRGVADV